MKKQQKTRESSSVSQQIIPVSDKIKKQFFIRQTFFFIYHLIRLALSVALIIIIAQTDIQVFFSRDTYLRMQETLTLWDKEVIVDIKTVSSYNCPQGYQVFTAATWPGTVEGCYCGVKFQIYDYFHTIPAPCTGKLIEAGCIQVQPRPSIPFVFWDADDLICIKRIRNLTFSADMSQIQETQTCAQNTEFQITSLNITECPITDITNDTSLQENLSDIGFSFSRQNNYPIIDLKMTEHEFCPDYDKPNISPNRFQNYVLQPIQIEYCQGFDPRVIEIDQMTQIQIFENNQRVYDVVMQMPGFPEPNDEFIYKLGMVRYPPWKYSCRASQDQSVNIAKNNFSLVQQANTSQVTIALVIILVSIWGIIYSIFLLIYNSIQLCMKKKNGTLYLTDDQIALVDPSLISNFIQLSILGHMIIFFIFLSLGIITAIILGVQYESVNALEEWFRDSAFCADEADYFVSYMSEYTEFFQEMIRNFLICILICVVFGSLDILYFVWRLHKGDLSGKKLEDIFNNEQEIENNSDEQKMNEKELGSQKDYQLNVEDVTEKGNNKEKREATQQSQINLTETSEMGQNDQIMIIKPKRKKNKRALRTTDIEFE